MRITENRLIDLAAAATTRNQASVGTASSQVTSGLRVTAPSDDPAAWLAAQRVKLHQALSQGSGAAVQTSRDRLQMTDGSLASIGGVISQVRALAVQGASDTYSARDRAALGAQVHGLFLNALAGANAQGPDGEYLLAGSASLTAPFDAAGAYHGDARQRAAPADSGVTASVTVSGASLTAAGGVDVLPLLDKVATALSSNDTTTLRAALPDLDIAVKQVAAARGQTGAAMSSLDQATTQRTALEQDLQRSISRFVEVDSVSAASELARASQALQVSQAVSAHIVALFKPSA